MARIARFWITSPAFPLFAALATGLPAAMLIHSL